jgi:O-antigen ligase
MKYVCENHPEKYIVEQIRLNYPEKYNAGVIYHVHNGYLMVFVSAGILGVALMLVFVALCLRRVVLYVFKNRQTSVAFVCAITVACSGAISAAFDKGVFFMNSVPTFLFWIALGIVMKESSR